MDRGGARLRRSYRDRRSMQAERFMRMLELQFRNAASAAADLELSEDDIFSCQPSPEPPSSDEKPSSPPATLKANLGILAALNENSEAGSKTESRRIVRASISASLSILSYCAAASISSRIMIPRLPHPRTHRIRWFPESAPVKIPIMPMELRTRAMELDDSISEGEESILLPPHEFTASKFSVMPPCSVIEGRDFRQVRDGVWYQSVFM
ncbi:hypothetical protein M569_07029, partial [Genlisea aurea]